MAELHRFEFGLTDEQREAIERRVAANETDPRFEARERMRVGESKADELENLQSMTNKALSGVYGPTAKRAAERWQGEIRCDPTRWHMEQLRTILQRIPGRQSG